MMLTCLSKSGSVDSFHPQLCAVCDMPKAPRSKENWIPRVYRIVLILIVICSWTMGFVEPLPLVQTDAEHFYVECYEELPTLNNNKGVTGTPKPTHRSPLRNEINAEQGTGNSVAFTKDLWLKYNKLKAKRKKYRKRLKKMKVRIDKLKNLLDRLKMKKQKRSTDNHQSKQTMTERSMNPKCEFKSQSVFTFGYPEMVQSGECLNKWCSVAFFKCVEIVYQMPYLKYDNKGCVDLPSRTGKTRRVKRYKFDYKEVNTGCRCVHVP